jgi:hypothetical protein
LKFHALIGFLLFSLAMNAQLNMKVMEDTLIVLFEGMEGAQIDDSQKLALNEIFKTTLHKTLSQHSSFKYDFKNLKSISVISAPDKKFKIFTWAFATSDGIYHYYGFTQYHDKKNKKIILRELKDNSNSLNAYSNYSDSTWYGAVYYEIVPVKKKSDTCYILLGWDGNDWMSKKRMIEPITFNHEGKITFGNKILKEKEEEIIVVKKSNKPVRAPRKEVNTGKEKQRIIFEYAAKAAMSLHYNKEMRMIVFDHLAPSDPVYTNMFMFYAPDFSYDAYYYKKNSWYLNRNIDVRNSKIIKAQPYDPKEDEDIKLKKTEFKRN